MSDENEFDLPSGDVSTTQLYVLVVAMRKDMAMLRTENTALRAENEALREEVAVLTTKVTDLTVKFEKAGAVTGAVKWIAIFGGAIIATIEGIRRYLT